MSDRERPWDKFYWADWESDKNLAQCSLAAQGLWMRILCICAKSSPRGYLTIADQPLDVSRLAFTVGKPETEVAAALDELGHWKVFSRDRRGRIYSRRMVNDDKRSKEGRKFKKMGLAEARKKRTSQTAQGPEKQGENPGPSRGPPSPPTREASRGPSPQRPEARKKQQASKRDGESPPAREGPAADLDRIGCDAFRAAGLDPEQFRANGGVFVPVQRWLAQGFTAAEIVEVFRRRAQSIASAAKPLAYANSLMAEEIQRIRAETAAEDRAVEQRWGGLTEAEWIDRIDSANRMGIWPDPWGWPPDDPGTQCPSHLRSRYRGKDS